jgi:hypothetical protein
MLGIPAATGSPLAPACFKTGLHDRVQRDIKSSRGQDIEAPAATMCPLAPFEEIFDTIIACMDLRLMPLLLYKHSPVSECGTKHYNRGKVYPGHIGTAASFRTEPRDSMQRVRGIKSSRRQDIEAPAAKGGPQTP